jgi:hypothetical protein
MRFEEAFNNNQAFRFYTDDGDYIEVGLTEKLIEILNQQSHGIVEETFGEINRKLNKWISHARIEYNNYSRLCEIKWDNTEILDDCDDYIVIVHELGWERAGYWVMINNIILHIHKLGIKESGTHKILYETWMHRIEAAFIVSDDTMNKLAIAGKQNGLTEKEIEKLSELKTTIKMK